MTAVIGILNKYGVALAADSAVTISDGDGRKIYNSAYKIFTLSKFNPVSIMIYNSATFMGIPWEILIKEYRKSLKNKEFNKLIDYKINFIKYLKRNTHLISPEIQRSRILSFIEYMFFELIKGVTTDNIDGIEKIKSKKGQQVFIGQKLDETVNFLNDRSKDKDILIDFKSYSLIEFKKNYSSEMSNYFKKYYSEVIVTKTVENKIYNLVHQTIIRINFWDEWTGLIFTGYGKNDIYPGCIPIRIAEVYDNRIRYYTDEENVAIINDDLSAAIRPFAQRDVIDIILSGIDKNLEVKIYESLNNFLTEFIELLIKTIGKGEKISDKLDKIDISELVRSFSDNFDEIKWSEHIDPLMSSISSLSKEDLAELAESLIYLTYLKRRMSFSEESVGGPIDVALITKGDGFVWIKRKHYFSKELNQDFIHKYISN